MLPYADIPGAQAYDAALGAGLGMGGALAPNASAPDAAPHTRFTTVTVTHASHRFKSGMSVTFAHATAVGGLTISGTYTVTSVTGLNTYTITAASAASSTATGGGYVDYTAALPAGLTDSTAGSGYGTGTYGTGFYGAPGGAWS